MLYAAGRGVPQDFAAALTWWRLAGTGGFSGRLQADAHACGLGVEQNYEKAVSLYREIADTSDLSGAAKQLGRMYRAGCGVDRDDESAEKYYRRAAGTGDPEAQIELSELYLTGVGFLQKPFDAYRWASYAAMRLSEKDGDLYRRAIARKQEAASYLEPFIIGEADKMVQSELARVRSLR